MCSHNNNSGTSSLEHHATLTPTLHAHFTFCDYLFVSLDSTRNSKSYLYKKRKCHYDKQKAEPLQLSLTPVPLPARTLSQCCRQTTNSWCQKVLAQSSALHVCLRRRCTRRSAYPANCQQDNRAERITSAACNNFTSRGGSLPLHLDRVADWLPFRLSVGVFGSIGALQFCHKADFDASFDTPFTQGTLCPHNYLFYTNICKKEGKSLTRYHVGQCLIKVSELASYQPTRVTIQK